MTSTQRLPSLRALAILILAIGFLLPACRQKPVEIVIHTSFGDMRVQLYQETPRHRDNFIRLVKEGFYDSLLFHRVVPDFMIQGGDPDSRSAAAGALLGNGGPGYDLPAEIKMPHLRGALAAARLGDSRNPTRASNGSQFFIVQGTQYNDTTLDRLEKHTGQPIPQSWRALYKQKGGMPALDGQYTVFGMVVEGLEVIDRIAAVPRDAYDRPLEDIRMWVEVVQRGR